jgi:hypothetical protein
VACCQHASGRSGRYGSGSVPADAARAHRARAAGAGVPPRAVRYRVPARDRAACRRGGIRQVLRSTRQEVIFSVALAAFDINTDRLYWGMAHSMGWPIFVVTGGSKPVPRPSRSPAVSCGRSGAMAGLLSRPRWINRATRLTLLCAGRGHSPRSRPRPEGNAALWRARSGLYQTAEWRRNAPFASLEILEKDPVPAERESAARRLIPSASNEGSARRCGPPPPRTMTSGSGGPPAMP